MFEMMSEASPGSTEKMAKAIALNAKMRDDHRVDATLLTVGDGFMLARKR